MAFIFGAATDLAVLSAKHATNMNVGAHPRHQWMGVQVVCRLDRSRLFRAVTKG
jgi:hypothetical protein